MLEFVKAHVPSPKKNSDEFDFQQCFTEPFINFARKKNFPTKDVDISEDKKDTIRKLVDTEMMSSSLNVVENAISQLYSYATKPEYSGLKDKLIFFPCHVVNRAALTIYRSQGIRLPVLQRRVRKFTRQESGIKH